MSLLICPRLTTIPGIVIRRTLSAISIKQNLSRRECHASYASQYGSKTARLSEAMVGAIRLLQPNVMHTIEIPSQSPSLLGRRVEAVNLLPIPFQETVTALSRHGECYRSLFRPEGALMLLCLWFCRRYDDFMFHRSDNFDREHEQHANEICTGYHEPCMKSSEYLNSCEIQE